MFLGLYRSAIKKVGESDIKSKPLIINNDDFRRYTKDHKLYDLQAQDGNGIAEQNVECTFNGNVINIRVQMHQIKDADD